MRTSALALAALLALGQIAGPVYAQTHTHTKTHKRKHTTKHPKSVAAQLQQKRRTNHTVRQITPSPRKSIGKHADNLSKNVNHEVNRESKDVNHALKVKKKK